MGLRSPTVRRLLGMADSTAEDVTGESPGDDEAEKGANDEGTHVEEDDEARYPSLKVTIPVMLSYVDPDRYI